MLWSRARVSPLDDRDLRRHSTFIPRDVSMERDQLSLDDPNAGDSQIYGPHAFQPRSQFRDSVVSFNEANEGSAEGRPLSPPIVERPGKSRRFSILRFRHASDSQLAKTAKEHANTSVPPVPSFTPPSIITTAPTQDNVSAAQKRRSLYTLPRRAKSPNLPETISAKRSIVKDPKDQRQGNMAMNFGRPSLQSTRITFEEPERPREIPPAYGDESNSALALPVSRLSESSRSDESGGDHGVFATTTTTHTVSTTTTFWRLPRRKKDKGPLFPLPTRLEPPCSPSSLTPRVSTSDRPSESPLRQSFSHTDVDENVRPSPTKSEPHSQSALAPASVNSTPGSILLRNDSRASIRTARSSHAIGRPSPLSARGRSSTMNSLRVKTSDEPPPTPPLPQSTRTSTSTTGRASLGGIFNLSRLRQTSEPMFARHGPAMPETPGSSRSNKDSINLPRDEPVVVPERQEGDTPAKYLARLEEVVSRGAIVALLSKSTDDFSRNVLRSYMRRFKFFEDPMDMAMRKMLLEVVLPKETQQIDRTMQSFADRYHECNPGIFLSPDEAYFIAFSILILHTDVYNRNNKHKMQKHDYTKNTQGQGITHDVLECIYDNICYTPFIHLEDDLDINGERIITQKSKKRGHKGAGTSTLRKNMNEPVDPYALMLDNKLDTLRPSLDEVLLMNDPFNYVGSAPSYNVTDLHRTFFRSGIIQILSSRSRPDAFRTQATITNPSESQVGVVDMKITKVGILWRKDTKRKKARSPWQEWGAILTGSQLYFFRNASWVKNLVHQHEHHQKHGRLETPVVFKPPLDQFKPDFLLSTENVVTLIDASYRKHKHALVFAHQNNYEEILLADNEAEQNDWLAKLNYAAAFRTAGVRMRGVIGSYYESQSSRDTGEGDNTSSTQPINGPTSPVSARTGKLDDELTQQVMLARRQIMSQKIAEAEEKLEASTKLLETQLRNARHLEILTPILQKSREHVIFSASKLATSIRWTRIDSWRTKCHRDILAMDLEDDVRLSSGSVGDAQEPSMSPTPSNQSQNRLAFGRLNSKASGASSQSSQRTSRPTTQPAGAKLFSMDEIFRSPSRLRSQHRHQSSWEIPPLSFEQSRGSGSRKRYMSSSEDRDLNILGTIDTTSPSLQPNGESSSVTTGQAMEIVTPVGGQVGDERAMLVEAGLFSPESTVSEPKRPDTAGSEDQAKVGDLDAGESISKVRHSLQRKLQNAHVPSHHRSKKNRESSSSAAGTDDNVSAESESLARGTGSFTVHGKKASVITFGSEWQNMPPEERLKLRKQAHIEDSKLLVPSAIEDDTVSAYADLGDVRPVSAVSTSTTTARSFKSFQQTPPPEQDIANIPDKSKVFELRY